MIGDLPNLYLYAANNPSEGAIAKRRAAATLVSYLTPPVAQAGLYKGLLDLKASLDRWRALPPDDAGERARLVPLIPGPGGGARSGSGRSDLGSGGRARRGRWVALTDLSERRCWSSNTR